MAEVLIDYKGVEVLRDEHVTLKNVDWQVKAGELVYLLGRVGSGSRAATCQKKEQKTAGK